MTAVQPPGRFGALEVDRVRAFEEEPRGDGGWTNGGFFVVCPHDRHIEGDATAWERTSVRRLARDGQLAPVSTTASGTQWTRCATATASSSCGTAARPLSGRGHGRGRPCLLVGPARFAHLTGHTGFKGACLSLWVAHMGVRVTGLSTTSTPVRECGGGSV